jgi:NAD-dependent DNA ligase
MATTPYPVYQGIANTLNADPEMANNINLDQLKVVLELSYGAPSVLLDSTALARVEEIYLARTKPKKKFVLKRVQAPAPAPSQVPPPTAQPAKPKGKLVFKSKAKASPSPSPSASASASPSASAAQTSVEDLIASLRVNHQNALTMSQSDLERVIRWSDQKYTDPDDDDVELLGDKEYDYVKKVYNKRRLLTNDSTKTMASISSPTGVGYTGDGPRKERDVKLPVALRSLDNIFEGQGDVMKWTSGRDGPYVVSAKMDGTSALYSGGHLYTRGDAITGRDISHVIQYLNLPDIPDGLSVRGEIVMAREIFDNKYKGKKGGNGVRTVNRNSVSGSLGAIHNIDKEFLSDLTFAAYEIIRSGPGNQSRPSVAFTELENMGFMTAYYQVEPKVNDVVLSNIYHDLLAGYEYEIDGLVVHQDQPYIRETSKNPEYAKAFKEALKDDIAITEVVDIIWDPSQYGYLKPTIVFKPVVINNVTISRATGFNAREVIKQGLGPGATIEVIHHAKVNPQIHSVLVPVQPYLPKVPYEWVPNGSNDPADIRVKFDDQGMDDESSLSFSKKIEVKRIHKFLEEIGVKGIGEITVGKIYERGFNTVGSFVNLTSPDIAFLGPSLSVTAIDSIQTAMHSITIPQLMAGSKVFARGLGTTKFTKLFKAHPEFIEKRLTRDQYATLFETVDGFGKITANSAADGMKPFWEFVDKEIPKDIYATIVSNSRHLRDDDDSASGASGTSSGPVQKHPDINGKNICLTGFRDASISDFITRNGGNVKESVSGTTNMVVRKSSSYTNKKTEFAVSKGIPLYDPGEFKIKYMS